MILALTSLASILFLTSILYSAFVVTAYELKNLDSSLLKPGVLPRIFSLQDLRSYDGSDSSLPVYMAVRGVVFDVSSSQDFYGKGAPYNALAGKDSSRAVAKMSLDELDLNDDISDLSPDELQALDERFFDIYKTKYPVVGFTVKAVGQNVHLFAGTVKDEL